MNFFFIKKFDLFPYRSAHMLLCAHEHLFFFPFILGEISFPAKSRASWRYALNHATFSAPLFYTLEDGTGNAIK